MITVLSLGWGVQSFTLAAMAAFGDIDMPNNDTAGLREVSACARLRCSSEVVLRDVPFPQHPGVAGDEARKRR